jgi:hypothetical protein
MKTILILNAISDKTSNKIDFKDMVKHLNEIQHIQTARTCLVDRYVRFISAIIENVIPLFSS